MKFNYAFTNVRYDCFVFCLCNYVMKFIDLPRYIVMNAVSAPRSAMIHQIHHSKAPKYIFSMQLLIIDQKNV